SRDWSSDVCSSDLLLFSCDFPERERAGPRKAPPVRNRADSRSYPSSSPLRDQRFLAPANSSRPLPPPSPSAGTSVHWVPSQTAVIFLPVRSPAPAPSRMSTGTPGVLFSV